MIRAYPVKMEPQLIPLFNATHRPARVSFTMSEQAKETLIKSVFNALKKFNAGRLDQKTFDLIINRANFISNLVNAPGFPIYYSLYTERDHNMSRLGYVFSAGRWSDNGDRRVIKSLAGFSRDQLLFDNFGYDRDFNK